MRERPRFSPWYREPERTAHEALHAEMGRLDSRLKTSDQRLMAHYRLFDQDACLAALGQTRAAQAPRVRLNVVRSAITAVHAKISQNAVRPMFLTKGQGWDARTKAKKTQAFVDGCMYHADTHEVVSQACMYAMTFGTAAIKTYWGPDGKPAHDAIFPREIRVDPSDGINRNPRVIYHYRAVSRERLAEQFDGDRKTVALVEAAPDASDDLRLYNDRDADEVAVCEAFLRPSRPGADDGRRVLALANATLVDETWSRPPPFAFLRWGIRPQGWEGYGIPEQLEALQYEINMLLMRIQEQLALAGPKIFVERGSEVNQEELDNLIWGVINYTGTPPTMSVFQAVQPELFQQLQWLRQAAFDEVGISQLAVRSEKPAGLNSGKALMTYADMESAKFIDFGKRVERLTRDVADLFLDMALDDEDRDIEVTYPVRRFRRRYLDTVRKADIVSSRDETICQVFPTSALPQTPAAKQQTIAEWQQMGWISKEKAVQLADFPDIDEESSLQSAPIEYIDFFISRMLDDGVPMRPEPWMDQMQAMQRASQALQLAIMEEVPEERWQLLTIFIDSCQRNIDAEKAEAAAQAAPAAPPPAAGLAPPGLPPGPGTPA